MWKENEQSVPHFGLLFSRLLALPFCLVDFILSNCSIISCVPDHLSLSRNIHPIMFFSIYCPVCTGPPIASVSIFHPINYIHNFFIHKPLQLTITVIYLYCRILVGNQEGKRPLGRHKSRWVDNINMN
jgi:hypothetical protein